MIKMDDDGLPYAETAYLTGRQLDWAVGFASCMHATEGNVILSLDLMVTALRNGMASPTTDIAHGLSILEKHNIVVSRGNDIVFPRGNEKGEFSEPLYLALAIVGRTLTGRTRLEAGLRCFVYDRVGERVYLPKELLE